MGGGQTVPALVAPPLPVPAGWEVRTSTRGNKPFYVQTSTQEASWEHPGAQRDTPSPDAAGSAQPGPEQEASRGGAGTSEGAGAEAASFTGSPLADHIIEEIKRMPEVAEQLAQTTGRCARETVGFVCTS